MYLVKTLVGAFLLYILASLIISVSALPEYYLMKYVLTLSSGNIFLVIFFLALSYFIFGTVLMLVVAGIIRIFRIRLMPGVYKINSKESLIWLLNAGLISLVRFLFLPFTRTNINVIFYRLLGAKIGKNVIINSTCIYDPHLIEIGDNSIIGGDVALICHSAEGDKLIIDRIKIGKNVSIGQYTTILPGAVIEDGAIIGAMSLVPKNKRISEGVWGGVPVRRLKK